MHPAREAINEAAIADVEPTLKPGVKATELTARLLRSLFELGAWSNTVDPIWQVMGRTSAERPRSITDDLVFPTPTRPASSPKATSCGSTTA